MDDDSKASEIRNMFERVSGFLDEVMKENTRLARKMGEVEAENRKFAERYVQIEEHNEVLQNLYVASHRLHATLEPAEVIRTISEIIINLVGVESFGIWMLDEVSGTLSRIAAEGLPESEPLSPEELSVADQALKSETWEVTDTPIGVRLLAMVPLRVDRRGVGLIVIRKLLGHKKELTRLDQQILGLLSGQAATALASARLYAEKSRKLETMKAFLDFIKKG